MPGGAPGLQNQCGAEKVPGGFDSHSPPPFFFRKKTEFICEKYEIHGKYHYKGKLIINGMMF